MGNNKLNNIYHPSELGITDWPFPYWQTFKQMQWMILSVGAVDFLRSDPMVLNYLAMLEHAFLPQETFFATCIFY